MRIVMGVVGWAVGAGVALSLTALGWTPLAAAGVGALVWTLFGICTHTRPRRRRPRCPDCGDTGVTTDPDLRGFVPCSCGAEALTTEDPCS